MSNPNTQKLGKRKTAPGAQPPVAQSPKPTWLFPGAKGQTQGQGQSSKKSKNEEKKLAEDLLKRRAAGAPRKSSPPSQLVELVGAFLSDNEFTHTSRSFLSERRSPTAGKVDGLPSLTTIFEEWSQWKEEKINPMKDVSIKPKGEKADVAMKDVSSGSDSTSESESDASSDADDESDAPVVKEVTPKPTMGKLKRKAPISSASSSSSDSSSEDEAPKPKKAKTKVVESPSSSSDSDSSSESSSESSSSSESGESSDSSSSDSDSTSDSDSSTNSTAQKVPLPDSDSDSSSSSSGSDSESSGSSKDKKPAKKEESDSSATLSKKSSSSDSTSDSDSDSEVATKKVTKVTKVNATITRALSPPLPPNPVIKPQKKTNVPFSRIPSDIKVDERLASNAYVPYDYAQKAHQDLIVTKGKGFTKEKNKKKRGSYRGGYIDVEGKKGIKFDD